MGNSTSSEPPKEKKTRNHSIAEFEYLLDPAIGAAKAGSAKTRSITTMQISSKDEKERQGSSKLLMLQKAKESGSFVSKKDILAIAGDGSATSANSADMTAIVPTPLRDIAPPTSEGDVVHPAKWLWKHPEFTLCMDEHGNTYYYNYTTQESTWDPPEDMSLPKAEISFTVIVPADATPGKVFSVQINGTQLEVMCPMAAGPGMTLELSNGQTEVSLFDNASNAAAARASDGANNVHSILEDEAAVFDTPAPVALAAAEPAPAPVELPTTVDDDTLWRALAEVAQVRLPFSLIALLYFFYIYCNTHYKCICAYIWNAKIFPVVYVGIALLRIKKSKYKRLY